MKDRLRKCIGKQVLPIPVLVRIAPNPSLAGLPTHADLTVYTPGSGGQSVNYMVINLMTANRIAAITKSFFKNSLCL